MILANEYDVMALSETLLTHRKTNINIKGFNHIRVDRGDGSNWVGMVIYIR